MAHDPHTLVQKQLILRVLPEEVRSVLHGHVSGTGPLPHDLHVFREDEQPTPPFGPAVNERMVFQLGGQRWPASLVDLPCPVETHRTFDRVTTFKSSDIGQILIVYADEEAREKAEAETRPKREGQRFTGNPSGLTPPTLSITRGRYFRTRSKLDNFPKAEVEAVESELLAFFNPKDKLAVPLGEFQLPAGCTVLADEEEVVDFEEYMWSSEGGEHPPRGVTVQDDDALAKEHPEIFVKPRAKAHANHGPPTGNHQRPAKDAASSGGLKGSKDTKEHGHGVTHGHHPRQVWKPPVSRPTVDPSDAMTLDVDASAYMMGPDAPTDMDDLSLDFFATVDDFTNLEADDAIMTEIPEQPVSPPVVALAPAAPVVAAPVVAAPVVAALVVAAPVVAVPVVAAPVMAASVVAAPVAQQVSVPPPLPCQPSALLSAQPMVQPRPQQMPRPVSQPLLAPAAAPLLAPFATAPLAPLAPTAAAIPLPVPAAAGLSATVDQPIGQPDTAAEAFLDADAAYKALVSAVTGADGDVQSASAKVKSLEEKVASAPNAVMKGRFAKDLSDAKALLANAAAKKAGAVVAANARREALLSGQ